MNHSRNNRRDNVTGAVQDSASKRTALAGQWSTPPLPVFPSGYGQHQQPGPQPQIAKTQHAVQQSHVASDQGLPSLPNPTSIPDNSEDYAKALQEAYRKGAEAAAMMAQQQTINIPTAASCPNFSTGPQTSPQLQNLGVSAEEAAYSHQVHPTPTLSAIPDPLSSSMPPPPPPPPPPASVSHAPTHHHHHHHHQHHQSQSITHPQHHDYSPATKQVVPSKSARSVSLPDMSAFAAQAEEEKRQKRLARNRASARLRRLRKKNLVDAYETEVGILEKTLKQLQAHEWGKNDDHQALLHALGMERGQQAIRPEQRSGIIQDILTQQLKQVELLRQSQLEQECLAMLLEDEQDDLSNELQEILQLSPAQKQELQESCRGLDKEVEALDTVASSLQAMLENDWLINEGVQSIVDQFTAILHKNQLSKFLLWTDANVEAIDQLDHVQVQPLQGAPIFTFGVETSPGDEE